MSGPPKYYYCVCSGVSAFFLPFVFLVPYLGIVCESRIYLSAKLEVLMLSVSQFDPNDPDDLMKAAWQTIDRMVYFLFNW